MTTDDIMALANKATQLEIEYLDASRADVGVQKAGMASGEADIALRAAIEALVAERDALKAERDSLITASLKVVAQMQDAEIVAKECDALRQDAERYRWLRQQHEGHEPIDFDADGFPMPSEPTAAAYTVFRPTSDMSLEPVGCIPGELDAAIDAARKEQTK